MDERNVHDGYLKLFNKLKHLRDEYEVENNQLEDVLNNSNNLLKNVSDTCNLKLDAKVTELHSDIFLKCFTNNVKKRKINVNNFISLCNSDNLNDYIQKVKKHCRRCNFVEFIDLNYFKEHKERKKAERIEKKIQSAKTPLNNENIDENKNVFLENLIQKLNKFHKIKMYDCILDYNSYNKTIENAFALSISLRSKLVELMCEKNEIYVIKFTKSKENLDEHIILELDYSKYLSLLNIKKHRKIK